MSSNAAVVIRLRLVTTVIVRSVSLFVSCFAVGPLASWMQEGISDGDLWDFDYYQPRIVGSVVLLVMGAFGWFAGARVVRWLTPVQPDSRCPGCDYVLEGSTTTCPECGVDVAGMWSESPASMSEAAWRSRVIVIATLVLRVIGLYTFLVGATWTCVVTAFYLVFWQDWFPDAELIAYLLTWPGILGVVGFAFAFLAGPVVRLSVPKVGAPGSQGSAGEDFGEP